MSPLGRGLSSLIPKRNSGNASDIIDRIDSEDSFDTEEEVKITTNKVEINSNDENVSQVEVTAEEESVNITLDKDEEIAKPTKPLVTLLSLDAFEDNKKEESDKAGITEEKKSPYTGETVKVQAVEEEDDIFAPMEEKEEEITPIVESKQEKVTVKAEEEIAPPEAAPMEEKEEATTPGFGESNVAMWDKHENKVEHVPVGDIIINPLQPRQSFDPAELEELASSIEQHGILQPLVVRRVEKGYELIAGERRLRSVKKLKWERVPCVVRRDVKSDQSRLVFALIENIQRENLNPIEEAMAYKDLNEEYGLSHEEIGHRVGRSRVGITNIIRILQLPAEIQRGLAENKITMGHARAILMIPDQEKQIRFYSHLLDEGLTVRKAEIRARRIQRTMNSNNTNFGRSRGKHPLALKYSPVLEDRYGYDANVRFLADKNSFEVVFKAHTEAEIEELVGRLAGSTPLPKDVDQDVIDD